MKPELKLELKSDYDQLRGAKSMQNLGEHAFIPEHYHISDKEEMADYIARHPMCQLNTAHEGVLWSSALPLLACPEQPGSYIGHLARRNDQRVAIEQGADALAVFTGPEAYISPRWFEQRKTVPTWNYLSIQMRGRLQLIDATEAVAAVMTQTAVHMEGLLAKGSDHEPWQGGEVDRDLYEGLLHGIVAFRFFPESIEGVKRLNQDKDLRDVKAIMRGLESTPQRQSAEILKLMSQQFSDYL